VLEELSKRPRLARDFTLSNPEGTGIYFAFCPQTGARFELNEVAYDLLGRMDGTASGLAICAAVAGCFEGAVDIESDYAALVRQLLSENLVELV